MSPLFEAYALLALACLAVGVVGALVFGAAAVAPLAVELLAQEPCAIFAVLLGTLPSGRRRKQRLPRGGGCV